MIGAGWVGLVTAACFAELGHEVWCRDIVQEKVESLQRGEAPIYEPGLAELLARNRERLHFTTDMGDVVATPSSSSAASTRPPTYSGDADLSRVERGRRRAGRLGRPRDRDEEHGARGHRPLDRAAGGTSATSRTRSSSRRARAVADFMHPDRVVVGYERVVRALRRSRRRPLRAARGRGRPHRHRERRDDQARVERLPRHEDLVHQRDRQRLRGAGRGRRRGGARDGPRRADRPAVPARGDRLRRLAASRRTSPRSSSSPATAATTSSS